MTEPLGSLQYDFTPGDEESWLEAVKRALKNGDVGSILSREVATNVTIGALGIDRGSAAEAIPAMRSGPWKAGSSHWCVDPKALNKDILADLEGGIQSVNLRIEAGLFPGLKTTLLPAALDGVFLDLAEIRLQPGECFDQAGRAFLDLLDEKGVQAPGGTAGIDPIGSLAQNGRLLTPLDGALTRSAVLAKDISSRQSNLSAYCVDGQVYHLAGADAAQELAILMAVGVAYLRAMESSRLDMKGAARLIELRVTSDAEFVPTIAKLRAVRLLWNRILDAAKLEGTSTISSTTAVRMLSVRDPWVNLLRSTVAGFAAGVGGADVVTLMPIDTLYGVPTAQARRISRNIHHILLNESSLGAVSDPSAGAWHIENLTSKLANAAWAIFQSIERQGGAQDYLTSGQMADDIGISFVKRKEEIARRKRGITGVSRFPDLNEEPLKVSGVQYAPRQDVEEAGVTINRLPVKRDAEPFEFYQMRNVKRRNEGRKPPLVLVATLGDEVNFSARLGFVQEALDAIGCTVVVQPVQMALGSPETFNAAAVVLCGSDKDYEMGAERAVRDLTARSVEAIWLAGRPRILNQLRQAGVKETLHMGCNMITRAEALWRGDSQ